MPVELLFNKYNGMIGISRYYAYLKNEFDRFAVFRRFHEMHSNADGGGAAGE